MNRSKRNSEEGSELTFFFRNEEESGIVLLDSTMIHEPSQVIASPMPVFLAPMPVDSAADFFAGKQTAAAGGQQL